MDPNAPPFFPQRPISPGAAATSAAATAAAASAAARVAAARAEEAAAQAAAATTAAAAALSSVPAAVFVVPRIPRINLSGGASAAAASAAAAAAAAAAASRMTSAAPSSTGAVSWAAVAAAAAEREATSSRAMASAAPPPPTNDEHDEDDLDFDDFFPRLATGGAGAPAATGGPHASPRTTSCSRIAAAAQRNQHQRGPSFGSPLVPAPTPSSASSSAARPVSASSPLPPPPALHPPVHIGSALVMSPRVDLVDDDDDEGGEGGFLGRRRATSPAANAGDDKAPPSTPPPSSSSSSRPIQASVAAVAAPSRPPPAAGGTAGSSDANNNNQNRSDTSEATAAAASLASPRPPCAAEAVAALAAVDAAAAPPGPAPPGVPEPAVVADAAAAAAAASRAEAEVEVEGGAEEVAPAPVPAALPSEPSSSSSSSSSAAAAAAAAPQQQQQQQRQQQAPEQPPPPPPPPPRQQQRVGPEDFALLRVVGQGSFGKVFQVRKRDTGAVYAMKVMRKEKILARDHGGYVRAERDVLTAVFHPYIVTLRYSFQTKDKLYLVLDFVAGGHLFFQLYRQGVFGEELARLYAAEIVLAVAHLHSLGFVHRDLKPENVLLDARGHVKVTDFGLAKAGLDDAADRRTNSFIGTVEYMAPEVVAGRGHGKAVDWWSVGVLLYEMLMGQPPFRAKGRAALARQITGGGKLKIPPYLSPEASSLLRALLQREPHKRLGFGPKGSAEVMAHPFFAPLDWRALLNSDVPSPFVPTLRAHDSVENFDKIWTDLEPEDSPCGTPRRPVAGGLAAAAACNGAGTGGNKRPGTPAAASDAATPRLPTTAAKPLAASAKKRIPSKTPSPAPGAKAAPSGGRGGRASNAASDSEGEGGGEEGAGDDDDDDDEGEEHQEQEQQLGSPYGEEAEALFRGFSYCAPSSLPRLVEKLQSAMLVKDKSGGEGGGGGGGA